MYSLTERQKVLLDFIKSEMAERNLAPSFEQMMLHMEVGSKSNIHRLLTGLEERGHIQRLKHRSRAIRIMEDK